MANRSNILRETRLLAEWLQSLPASWAHKTHVPVGEDILSYNGRLLTPAMRRMFGVWHDWADARVVTGLDVWIVEAKIVAKGSAYGEVLDYADQYPASADYQQYRPLRIRPVVLAAFTRDRCTRYFERLGVMTITFTPSWAAQALASGEFHVPLDAQGNPATSSA
jgi:hypothetical protein